MIGVDLARLHSARNGVYAVFTLTGVAFASWASRIPDIKANLDLTPGQLGLTFLIGSIGSMVGLPIAGRLAHRFGAALTCLVSLLVIACGLIVVGIGTDVLARQPVVAIGLFTVTVGMGVCDVAMNLEGATVERLLARSIMPRFHAAFSGGTVLAALVGAGMAAARIPVWLHLLAAAALVAGAAVPATRAYLPRTAEAAGLVDAEPASSTSTAAARSAWTEPRTLLIGLVTLVAAFTEGTANDWMSVAFVDGHDLPRWAGVLAFAAFLAAMTLGRVFGTHLLDAYGRVPVLRLLFVIAGAGSLLVVFGTPVVAYAGTLLWGVGASLGFPAGMSAAADDPVRAHARVSTVATIGYVAFLAGPPLLGFLGDHVGVLRALLVVGAMLVPALLALPAMREQRLALTANNPGSGDYAPEPGR